MRPIIFSKMDFSHSSLFGYIEDLQELTIIERPVRRSLKTPEEIERLTVDEELSDIERALFLLSSGQDIQGTSVVANLPVLMRQNPAETLRRVLPKIRVHEEAHPENVFSHMTIQSYVDQWRRLFGNFVCWRFCMLQEWKCS
ncbi:serine/threonine-protein phosphatase 4 regulatory subunit 4 isoform X4 [Parus major]|uniref:serine/threonine-protein phosphatase 4 regulatory subunit 4 isoform X4 n=1 Tax=Parus major TaxID=9157 RepID=UPI0007714384|nr:serine/threonine-protein phosphatase 4 regulatory subunit 4 isoform X4 [Parus major]XP_023783414.1 serine/threonine-protein phosphatase 4 regulatory subunit 4 isoform X8 [Cyanistes caeruleus]